MEFVCATKRHKKWKKKRYLRRKRLQERVRIEVTSAKHWELYLKHINFDARKILGTNTSSMEADTFWKNYAIAQEWQKRHSVTWWRSRCLALEHENEMLRNKVRLLAQHHDSDTVTAQENNCYNENNDEAINEENCTGFNSAIDVEFNVTEDMLDFFETSERHRRQLKQNKRKLKQNRQSKKIVHNQDLVDEISITDGAESIRAKKQEADFLYGDDGFKILAMETALQTAMDKYKDIANPQYWPNIPFKP